MLEGKRISELETVTNLQQGCCFPVLSTGATKRITFGSLLSEIENNLPETGIEQVKEDVAELKVKTEKIDTLSADIENVKEEVADVDEMVQGQNATIRNCVSTVNDLEETIAQTHFDDVLELEGQVRANTSKVNAIEPTIPAQASAENQLADKAFVNSTVGTNTAIFRGTFNSLAELEAYSGEKTNNDYAFVTTTTEGQITAYNRYKYNGASWVYEYTLNNSSFTAVQWAAINSGITAEKVELIPDGPVAQINDETTDTTHAWSGAKVAAEIEAKHKYSTEETVVGEWIDGKPIYRKIVNFTFAGQGVYVNVMPFSTSQEIVDIHITCKYSNSEYYVSTSKCSIYCDGSYLRVAYDPSSYLNGKLATAIIEYTKTTD